jgi:hypothetical protein
LAVKDRVGLLFAVERFRFAQVLQLGVRRGHQGSAGQPSPKETDFSDPVSPCAWKLRQFSAFAEITVLIDILVTTSPTTRRSNPNGQALAA